MKPTLNTIYTTNNGCYCVNIACLLLSYVYIITSQARFCNAAYQHLHEFKRLPVAVTDTVHALWCPASNTCPTGACARRYCRELESQSAQLRGSMAEDAGQAESSERDSRLGFTVWTTSTSTLTVTTTSVNSATTVSVSYSCTVAGYNSLPLCG